MVVRRKYRAKSDHASVAENVAAEPAQASPIASGPTSGGDEASPLQAALAAQQHAEELQRQHAQRHQIGLPEPPIDATTRQAIDAHVDAMPGLSAHKKRFLKSHPSLLTEPYVKLMGHAYQLALHAGVADDTPAMDHAILAGVARDIEHHRALSALTSAQARPTPENHQAHLDASQAAAELQREAEAHLAAHQPAAPAPSPSPQRRTIPMSAPPSRDAPSVSGRRPQDNTLSRDEREVARVSFPHLSAERAEYAYLQNKKKMVAMKANGEIQGDR